jgi:hypothetical protein
MIIYIILILSAVGTMLYLLSRFLNNKFAGTNKSRWMSRSVLFNILVFISLVIANEYFKNVHLRNISADLGKFGVYDLLLSLYLITVLFSAIYLLNYAVNHWLKSTFQYEIQKYMWIVLLVFAVYVGREYPKYEGWMYFLGSAVFFTYYVFVIELGWMLKKDPSRKSLNQ